MEDRPEYKVGKTKKVNKNLGSKKNKNLLQEYDFLGLVSETATNRQYIITKEIRTLEDLGIIEIDYKQKGRIKLKKKVNLFLYSDFFMEIEIGEVYVIGGIVFKKVDKSSSGYLDTWDEKLFKENENEDLTYYLTNTEEY